MAIEIITGFLGGLIYQGCEGTPGVMEMFYTLDEVMVTWVSSFSNIIWSVYLKSVNFLVCKLELKKKKKKGNQDLVLISYWPPNKTSLYPGWCGSVGLNTSLQTKGLRVPFPVRTHAWVVGHIPSRGHRRDNHTLMFPSFSFILPYLPSKIK